MNEADSVAGFPPIRQEKGEWMGHGRLSSVRKAIGTGFGGSLKQHEGWDWVPALACWF
jgi:hypothetical protein